MFFLPYLIFLRLHRHAIDARRKDRTWRYLMWSVVSGVSLGVIAGTTFFLTWILLYLKLWWIAVPFAAIVGAPLLAPVLARHVVVRLGWRGGAWWLGRLDWGQQWEAYSMTLAAWAYMHAPTPTAEAWLIEKRDQRLPLGDTEIIVTALLAAGRGDADTARALLRSTSDIVEVHARPRELAGEWLAVDAMERGAWAELHADAVAARWPATALTYFLEGIAARRVGAAGAPGKAELVARWLIAPHRRSTFALLADVPDAAPPAPAPPAETDAAAAEPAPMPHAVAAHLALEGSTTAPSPTAFAGAVHAWDAALADPALRVWLARRALELDTPPGSVDRAVRDVTQAITDDLVRVAKLAHLGAPPARGLIGGALTHRLRHGRLDALEAGFTRWADRRHSGVYRAPIDEWREWVALRAAYEDAVGAGGHDLRRLAFPHAYSTGTSMAVWLWNTRKEHAVSHAISTWLLAEALAVGDTQAIDTCTQNTRLSVPTRTGRFEPKP